MSRILASALVPALALAATLVVGSAHAQSAASPGKKALVTKVLAIQQPVLEGLARQLAEQPAAQLMQQAALAAQRLPADKRDAVFKDLQADARKYADEAVPLVRERALKLAPTTIGAVLEEKMTEDELKQLVGVLENPAFKKFTSLGPDMQRALGEKLIAETKPSIEPKVRALEQSMLKKLQAAAAAAPAASQPAAGK